MECINKGTSTDDIDARLKEITTKRAADTSLDQIKEEQDFYRGDDSGDLGDPAIIQAILDWGGKKDGTKYSSSATDPCDLISGKLQNVLHDIFFIISIAGIIILVVMTAISLVKIITASEDNALSNFVKGLWKRIICLIILLLLPMLITFIIQIVNDVAPSLGIKSNNPLCDITK